MQHSDLLPFSRSQLDCTTFWDHTVTVPPLQDHNTVHSIKDLSNMLSDSIGDMQCARQIIQHT